MMDSFEALKVLARHRGDAIVLATMTAAMEWSHAAANPDPYLPVGGAMGKVSSLGLGLALALPDRKILVLDGDGSLLMNLGTLVTIANMAPPNLVHFVFENDVYRTTGGQPIPGIGKSSFIALAKGAGYANVYQFADLESLENSVETVINQAGPTFVCLKLPPATERPPFTFVRTINAIPRFKAALQR